MAKVLYEIDTQEFLSRLGNKFTNGILDLSNLDMSNVDMSSSEIRDLFSDITTIALDYRGDPSLVINMTNSNISGRDFSNYNLSHVIMTGVTAEFTLFTNCNLNDVNLDEANINGADCRNANFTYCKLYNTSINATNFNFANLETAYGLGFGTGDEAIKRLGAASSIAGAKLPENIEAIRDKIDAVIENNVPIVRKEISKKKPNTNDAGW